MNSAKDRLLRNLDWNLLYTFLVIVDSGGISAAARKLSLSQPSVSNALKRLEDYTDHRLILRKKGVFSLTLHGMRVYEYASSASRIIGNMADQVINQTDFIQGELNIEIASHLECPAFNATLAHYHQLFPNVFFNINTQPSSDIVSHVADGLLRIGLSNKKVAQTGIRCDFLGYEQLGFYCGPSHQCFGKASLKLNDIKGLPYISFESDQPGEGLDCIANFRKQQEFWGKLVAISSNLEEVRRLIMTGIGFGALTVESAKPYVKQGLLWPLPPYEALPVTEMYLVTPDTISLNEIEAQFVRLLKEQTRKNASSDFHAKSALPNNEKQ